MFDDALEAFMSRKMSRSLRNGGLCIFCCLLSFALLPICIARDTITPNQNITDGETLVSSGKVFELGFFSPDKKSPTKATYLGMWYHGIEPQTVVWVANRDRPVTDYPGVFAMTNDGNLQVIDGKGSVLWSALPSTYDYGRFIVAVASLLDNGNFVLNQGNYTVWESFSYPSDTFLPGMNMRTKTLQSWKSKDDPAPGDFSFSLSVTNQFTIHNHSDFYWTSGWADSSIFLSDVPYYLASIMVPEDKDANANTVMSADAKFRLFMNLSGHIEFLRWGGQSNSWILYWTEPKDVCSFYNTCGDYGVCSSSNNKLDCKCLPGFVPNSEPQWKSGAYSSGCKRETTDCTEHDSSEFEMISLC